MQYGSSGVPNRNVRPPAMQEGLAIKNDEFASCCFPKILEKSLLKLWNQKKGENGTKYVKYTKCYTNWKSLAN